MYRLIDFRRNKDGVPAVVDSVQYDPNRTARIALLYYKDGEKRYILAPEGLKAGDKLLSGPEAPPVVGNCLPLSAIPLGMDVHNIEMQPGRGGVLCRSAGSAPRWRPATPIGPSSTCPAAKSAACRPPARRRSAAWATPTT